MSFMFADCSSLTSYAAGAGRWGTGFFSTLTERSFYAFLMSNNESVELLFSLLEKSIGNPKELISIKNY